MSRGGTTDVEKLRLYMDSEVRIATGDAHLEVVKKPETPEDNIAAYSIQMNGAQPDFAKLNDFGDKLRNVSGGMLQLIPRGPASEGEDASMTVLLKQSAMITARQVQKNDSAGFDLATRHLVKA